MNSLDKLKTLQNKLIKHITKLSFKYHDKESIKIKLEKLYNELHNVNHIIEEITGYNQYECIYQLEHNLPIIFTTSAKPITHDIDNNLLSNAIGPKAYYTEEEAKTLIKWTVNNTRNNLIISNHKNNTNPDDLMGCCGFSQFSSLYPLQQLGLKITINNVSSFCKPMRHAFGTVTVPFCLIIK